MTNCSLEDMGLQNSPEKVRSIWHTRFTVSATVLDLSCQMCVAQNRSGDLTDAVKTPSLLQSQGVVPGVPKLLFWLTTAALFNCFIFPSPHQEISQIFDSGFQKDIVSFQAIYKKEILQKFLVYLTNYFFKKFYGSHLNEMHRTKLITMLSDLLYNLKTQKAICEFQDMMMFCEP